MNDAMRNERAVPDVVNRITFQAELDALRAREKAHTKEGDALAAARRRLPMVEVDSATPLVGKDGTVTLLDTFEGRRPLIAPPDHQRATPDRRCKLLFGIQTCS